MTDENHQTPSGETRVPAFIHIPKTGGTYLAQRESDRRPVLEPMRYLGHCAVADLSRSIPEDYPPQVGYRDKPVYDETELARQHFVFTTVRNPYDWLVSYWEHAGGVPNRYTNTEHYDYEIAQRGFDFLVRAISERDDVWPSRKLIHFAAFSYHGSLIVDWINRNESLDADVAALAEHLGATYRERPRQRVGSRAERDYRAYYDERLAALVADAWGRELRLFGYSFEGPDPESAVLGRCLSSDDKRRARYEWALDELVIEGEGVG